MLPAQDAAPGTQRDGWIHACGVAAPVYRCLYTYLRGCLQAWARRRGEALREVTWVLGDPPPECAVWLRVPGFVPMASPLYTILRRRGRVL